ncbi:MAG: molecular chaperone [Bacteroidales bacterium]|nr:molecular chaperone [Bacteroidales bacterium]
MIKIINSKKLIPFFSWLMMAILFLPSDLHAQGNLLITPRRVVFDGSDRSFDLNLANTGKDTSTYAISIVQIRMNEDGSFENITEPDPDQRFADRYIRYFPRSVTLGPSETQVIKLQLIRSNELQEGEYRSHMYFRSVPRKKPLGTEEEIRDTTTISVRLTPVFGITIPVIIRKGTSTASVKLSDLNLEINENSEPVISFVFNRTGNMSVYGNILVEHISPQGSVTRAGVLNGVAVYTPNNVRKLRFNLINTGIDYTKGKLRVTYSSSSDVKPVRYDQAELVLGL